MWNWCFRELIVGCGLALVIGGGVWQGRLLGRWQPLPNAAVVDLSSIPRDLGEWKSTEFELPAKDVKMAEIDRYLGRHYEHADSGQIITVLIVSGPGGPISVHPPEVCFAGRGYTKDSVIVPVKIPSLETDRDHQFSMAIFRGPESTDGHRVQLFWSWSDSGIWSTPSNPRLAFARLPRIYKIYVSRTLLPTQGREDVQECVDFMHLLLPEFERLMSAEELTPGSPPAPAAEPAPSETSASTFRQSPLPALVMSQPVRRIVPRFAKSSAATFPVKDGDFRL